MATTRPTLTPVALSAALLLAMSCDKTKSPSPDASSPTTAAALPTWPADASASHTISITPSPTLTLAAFPLVPASPDAPAWTRDPSDELTLTQRADSGVATLRATQGDPTLRGDLTLQSFDPSQTTTLTWTLPKPDELTALRDDLRPAPITDQPLTIHAWTPGWLQWRRGDTIITLTLEGHERLTISPTADAIELTWTLWDHEAHEALSPCDASGWKLHARWSITVGPRAPLIASRYPDGRRAALSPLFFDPARLSDKAMRKASSSSAQDWLQRAQTLLHGHSSNDDPRFGNGGLLGSHLGGALSVPNAYAKDQEIRALIDAPPSGAALFIDDDPRAAASLHTAAPPCQQLPAAPHQVAAILGPISAQAPDATGRYATSPHHEVPALVAIPQLNGARQTLLTNTLSSARLRSLIEQRAALWFATPLLATRDPLISAASQALLEPERQGQWTLQSEVAATLGELELLGEEALVWFGPLTALLHHQRQLSRVTISPLPDGAWLIDNPGEPIPGFTLLSPADLNLDTSSLDERAPQRWTTLDLPSGATVLKPTDAPPPHPAPTRWLLP
jgi:hypothetical protein